MKTTWVTCRPNGRYLATWFAVTSVVSLMLISLLFLVDLQASMVLMGALAVIIAVCGSVLLRARFRYNDKQIQSRYFRNIERTWDDVAGWSLIAGRRINLYLRFSDGVTVGSNQWILSEGEIIELIPLLLENVGDPQKSDKTILPWPYRFLVAVQSRRPNNAR